MLQVVFLAFVLVIDSVLLPQWMQWLVIARGNIREGSSRQTLADRQHWHGDFSILPAPDCSFCSLGLLSPAQELHWGASAP